MLLYIPKENLDKYNKVSVCFTFATNITKCISCKLSTNLILTNLFNPNREVFVINLQNPHFFMNREFKTTHLQLNDTFLDFIIFELDFTKDPRQAINLPSLEFKIELDFHEN